VTAEEHIIFEGTPIVLRPIHPGDEKAHREFLESLRPEDFRRRFFEAPHPYGADELWRYTHPDPSRESAFIAIEDKCEGRVLGVARAVRRKDPDRAEFAVVVRSDLKGHGLGSLLLDRPNSKERRWPAIPACCIWPAISVSRSARRSTVSAASD
jgi:acetyltransferase